MSKGTEEVELAKRLLVDSIWRTAKKMQHDIEIAERLDRGEDPWGDDDDEPGEKKGKGDGGPKE